MGKTSTRDQIVRVADQMFYEQGYENTSFADIAKAVKISRGNFYYHFKSKDDILDAVIDVRLKDREDMTARWEVEAENPSKRLRKFIDILLMNREKISSFGCPIGTLTSELAKLNHDAQSDAIKLFDLFRTWLRRQFVALGREADADKLAMHLLAGSQGIATLYNAFHDDEFLTTEVQRLNEWVDAQAELAGKVIDTG